jgi:hypothetical protein
LTLKSPEKWHPRRKLVFSEAQLYELHCVRGLTPHKIAALHKEQTGISVDYRTVTDHLKFYGIKQKYVPPLTEDGAIVIGPSGRVAKYSRKKKKPIPLRKSAKKEKTPYQYQKLRAQRVLKTIRHNYDSVTICKEFPGNKQNRHAIHGIVISALRKKRDPLTVNELRYVFESLRYPGRFWLAMVSAKKFEKMRKFYNEERLRAEEEAKALEIPWEGEGRNLPREIPYFAQGSFHPRSRKGRLGSDAIRGRNRDHH